MKIYRVIVTHAEGSSVLTMDLKTSEECEKSIRHQISGGFNRADYHICTYDGVNEEFVDRESGERFKPTMSPYTYTSWKEFQRQLKEGQ